MRNLGKFGDILGIILLPFIAIVMIIISPIILFTLWVKYLLEEIINKEKN